MIFFKLFLLILLKVVEGILSISLTVIFVIPFISIIWFLNWISRVLVTIVLYCRYSGRVRLSGNGLDNIWGYRTPGNGNCRNALFVAAYSHKIDGVSYRNKFLSDVIGFTAPDGSRPYERLKKIFVRKCGYYCWEEDTNFDINNHVIIYPEHQTVKESQLMDLLSMLSQDMSETHPQWQEIIIPNFEYDMSTSVISKNKQDNITEQSLRILRFHHSYGKL